MSNIPDADWIRRAEATGEPWPEYIKGDEPDYDETTYEDEESSNDIIRYDDNEPF